MSKDFDGLFIKETHLKYLIEAKQWNKLIRLLENHGDTIETIFEDRKLLLARLEELENRCNILFSLHKKGGGD